MIILVFLSIVNTIQAVYRKISLVYIVVLRIPPLLQQNYAFLIWWRDLNRESIYF